MKVQLANCSLDYEIAGAGPVVVLLHAFPLARTMWRSQLAALQNDFTVIAPDFRGFGGSSRFDSAPSVDRFAEDVIQLLDVLKITEPVVVCGLSMGGYVALALARRYPERLRALVLADTRAEADDEQAKANRDKLIEFARSHSVSEVLDQLLPKLLSSDSREQQPQVVAEVKRIAAGQTSDGVIGALRAMRDRPDASASLAKVRVPTLVIVGEDDALTPPNLAEKLQTGIAGAKLSKIPKAGHLSNLEQSVSFNETLLQFLQSLPK